MAQSAQITKLSPLHEDMIAFLVAHPECPKGKMAAAFGVTPAWLSTIIHSGVFQARLAERQEKFFAAATLPLRDKLEAVAHQALDRLSTVVEVEQDTTELRQIATMALDRIGLGPSGGPHQAPQGNITQVNNYIGVARELLDESRRAIIARGRAGALIEGEIAEQTTDEGSESASQDRRGDTIPSEDRAFGPPRPPTPPRL